MGLEVSQKAMNTIRVAAAAAALGLTGCQVFSSPEVGTPFFSMTVHHPTEVAEVHGQGHFHENTTDGIRLFAIVARGLDPAREEQDIHDQHRVWVDRWGGHRLKSGTYEFTLIPMPPDPDPNTKGITALYLRPVPPPPGHIIGWAREMFAAESGTVTITRSTSQVVEGEFTFQAFLFCLRTESSCGVPAEPPPGAERVLVTGTFRVVRLDNQLVPDVP